MGLGFFVYGFQSSGRKAFRVYCGGPVNRNFGTSRSDKKA